LSGSLSGAAISLFLAPAAPLVCSPGVTLSGTLAVSGTVTGDRLTGRYVILTCDGATGGTIDVTKQ
jgi:hypothetical protein